MIVEGKGEKRREKDMGEHMDIMIMQNGTHKNHAIWERTGLDYMSSIQVLLVGMMVEHCLNYLL